MSRSYKKGRIGKGFYRNPKGHKQARIQGGRKGAVPPDPWDDLCCSSDNFTYHTIAKSLHKNKGWNFDKIIRHLMGKYGLEFWQARRVIGWGFYPCDCPECNRKYDI